MDPQRRLRLMRLADGERIADDPAAPIGGLPPDEAAYVAELATQRALLRAAFPSTANGLEPARRTIEAALTARRRSRRMWQVALPLAASVLVAMVTAGGAILVTERRAEERAARIIAQVARDQLLRGAALAEALDRTVSGETVAWRNPDSGSSGTVTPLRTFRARDGRWCREYEQAIDGPGGPERVVGIACREADTWRSEAVAESET
jgi:surface antigen